MTECMKKRCIRWGSRNMSYCYRDCVQLKYEYTKYEVKDEDIDKIKIPCKEFRNIDYQLERVCNKINEIIEKLNNRVN